jgi:hypothetical protein
MAGWLVAGVLLISVGLFLTRPWLTSSQWWGSLAADFFYFIGLPYLTLISGLLSPRLFGLKGLEHQPDLVLTTLRPELQSATTLFLGEVFQDSQLLFGPALFSTVLLFGLTLHLARYGLLQTIVPLSWLAVIYEGFHWAFYRAIAWFLSGTFFLGLVGGTLLIIAELAVVDYRRKVRFWQSPSHLLKMLLLIFTTLLFSYSLNLWLVWLFHFGAVLMINRVGKE